MESTFKGKKFAEFLTKELGIPVEKIKITPIPTIRLETTIEQQGISIPTWFSNTFTKQEIFWKGEKYLVYIRNLDGDTIIDMGIYIGKGEVEDLYQRIYTYGIARRDVAEYWIPTERDISALIQKALLIDAEIRGREMSQVEKF